MSTASERLKGFHAVKEGQGARNGWLAPDSDLAPMVEIVIDGEPFFVAVCPGTEALDWRDHALMISNILVGAFRPERVVVMLDAHMREQAPDEPFPEPGSLQRACHEDGAYERREISDVIIVNVLDVATKTVSAAMQTYFLKPDGIEWGEVSEPEVIDGYVYDSLLSLADTPWIGDSDLIKELTLSEAERETVSWMMGLEAVTRFGAVTVPLSLRAIQFAQAMEKMAP